MWLIYWLCYVAGSFTLYWFGWLLGLPFLLLAYVVDVYYEAQLLLVCFLVFPDSRGGPRGIEKLKQMVCSRSQSTMLMLLSKLFSGAPKRPQRPQDRPGPYVVIMEAGVTTTLETAKASAVEKLQVGQNIEVLEVVQLEEGG